MISNSKPNTFRSLLCGTTLAAALAAVVGISAPAWAQAQQTPDPNRPQVQLVEKSKHGDWSIRCPTIVNPKKDETTEDPSGKGDLNTTETTENTADPNTPDLSGRCVMMQGAPHTQQTDVQIFVTVKKNKVQGKVIGELHVNVPLYIVALLPKGVGIEIDGDTGNAKEVPFVACPPPPLGVCIAIQQLNDTVLSELKKGSATKIYLWQVNGQSHIFNLSLKGFTKAYEELQSPS